MIRNQDLTTLFVVIILLIFYFLQIFQRVKLVYLFRSVSYHFRNILVPYNVDDLGISGSGTSIINYFNYFYLFFFLLINIVVMTNFGAISFHGSINFDEMGNELFIRLLNFNILIFITLSVRFLVIKYIIEMFLNYKLKFIFFKNYIVNIIIGILMLINFVVYSLNTFYDFIYLRNTFLVFFFYILFFKLKTTLVIFQKLILKKLCILFCIFVRSK